MWSPSVQLRLTYRAKRLAVYRQGRHQEFSNRGLTLPTKGKMGIAGFGNCTTLGLLSPSSASLHIEQIGSSICFTEVLLSVSIAICVLQDRSAGPISNLL